MSEVEILNILFNFSTIIVLKFCFPILVFENDADCVDIRDVAECQRHKEMDKYCEYEEKFMLENCPKTCNLCHSTYAHLVPLTRR